MTHPADVILRQALADAHHFTCTILLNRRFKTYRFDTLAEARAYKPKLATEAANNRKAMVYAVTRAGTTHFIPDSLSNTS